MDWLAEVVNGQLEVDSDEDKETGIEDQDEEIEQEEEVQVVEEQYSEILDVSSDQFEDITDSNITYSVIEVLESGDIPEDIPRVVSGRTTHRDNKQQVFQTHIKQLVYISNTIVLRSSGT